jgi:peptidoglycan hydrolase CwlO-like protein
MKKLFLTIIISIFSVVVFSQALENPTLRAPFTESTGNFLVLTPFDKIGKSGITISYVNDLRQELDEAKKVNSQQQEQLNETKRTISEQQRQLNDQKKELEELKNSVRQLTRKVEDLQRKVK